MRDLKNALHSFKWFGRAVYHQKDVDALISSLQADGDATESSLRAAGDAMQTLNAQMTAAKESEREAREALAREQEAAAAERETIAAEREHCRQELAKVAHLKELAERYEALEQEKQQVENERQEQESSLAELSARFQRENMNLRKQMDEVKFELEESQKRSQHLLECLDAERDAVREYQSIASQNAVGEANERAKKIVSDAIVQSDKILSEVVDQRTRVISASRSMYYNALQFKMSLAKRFSTMEKDLDEAIDLLRILEATPFSGAPEEPSRILDKDEEKTAK